MTDILRTKLISEGVKENVANEEKYLICPGCLSPLSTILKPVLLECGHIVCEKESSNYENCPEGCGKLKIRSKPFQTLLKFFNEKEKEEKNQYLFTIRNIDNSTSIVLPNVKGNTKFHELVKEVPALELLLSKTEKIQLTIKNKSVLYQTIKNRTVHDYINQHKLHQGLRKNASIDIIYSSRVLGGAEGMNL